MPTVRIYRAEFGRCPYLPERSWVTDSFATQSIDPALYERLLAEGWRRSGHRFYRNHCPGCRACIPIRVPVDTFVPTRSQRRVFRRNRDIRCELLPAEFREESFTLYGRYVRGRHAREDSASPESYREFLVDSAVPTAEMQYRVGNELVGIGWLDLLPGGLSSVYYAFDPAESRRSLGTYSIMREIEETRLRGGHWYYLGFYVPDSPSMDYKARFFPLEILLQPGIWTRISSPEELASTVSAWDPFTRLPEAPR